MTRNNNSKPTYSPARSALTNTNTNDDNFINLPDLSGLKDDEKQHILNVLLRDENLRNKHLSRFMQLRKEVADLEQKPQTTSSSTCARCQTPFGFIFNTGDTCPKCGAKVCKQCRLIYNVNDSGWLCKLCCKQMQLMSYSGEWIYPQPKDLRKKSTTASDIVRKSLSPQISTRQSKDVSSSETETEDVTTVSNRNRPTLQRIRSNQQNSNNDISRMVVQTSTDEQKLNSIKQNAQKRPYQVRSAPRTRELAFSSNTQAGGSSDDVDSLFEQSNNNTDHTSSSSIHINTNDKHQGRNSSLPKSTESLSAMQSPTDPVDINHIDKQDDVDCASVTSSEWGVDSERGESTLQRHNASIKHNSKQNLASRMHLTGSIQSLRNAVHRIPKPHLSTSHTSLNSEQKSTVEISDATSTKISDQQNQSDSRSKLFTKNDSNSHLHESSNTLTPDQPIQRVKSITDSIRTANTSSQKKTTKPEIFGSVGNLDVADSDDDIDGTFEKAKLGLQNRASSYMDIRGSQLSINSILSDTKARYGLDISGTIELKLTYTLTIGALDVFINKCTNLARAKRHASDPFVKVYLLPDRSKNSKRKTEIKKNTTDPLFEAKFRYHVTKQEFETRILWISVWSQASLGHNDFLGEIHIPLANCVLDKAEEYQLLAKKHRHDLTPNLEPTMDPGEIQFQLTFTENPKNKDIGALQVQSIEGKAIYYGKNPVEAICKGLLMPDNIKRKLPNMRKGPTPKWEVPLRWDGVRRDNLQNTSVEISIWCHERFRKIMLGFVRLNLAQGYFDNKSVKWLDATNAEKSAWETFLRDPTQVHHFKLPLRPATMENK